KCPVTEIPKLSVVMPAYNEMTTIEEILCRVQAIALDKEIVVIDDGSKDGTREFLTQLQNHIAAGGGSGSLAPFGRLSKVDNIRIIFQEKNCGKGAALRRGFEDARGEVVVIQDADLELDPREYPNLIAPIERGLAEIVYGSRFLGRSGQGYAFDIYSGTNVLS